MAYARGSLVAQRFRLLAPAGADAFRARDETRGDEVRLEILRGPPAWRDGSEHALGRLAEAGLDGVPAVRSWGRLRGALYLATAPVGGEPLSTLAEPWPLIARWIDEALTILGRIHELGIRHGAFEPELISVGEQGVVLAALGRCQPFGTAEGLGTPAYLAPELVAGREADGRADLFSAGVLLRQLSEGRDDVPEHVVTLSARLLQASPEDRPAHAAEVAADLLHPVEPDWSRPGEAEALAALARAIAEAPSAIATSEAAAELVEDLLAEGDAEGVETVLTATREARRAHPSSWLSAARALVAFFPSVPAVLTAIDVLAASHPDEALSAIAQLRRARRAAPRDLYRRAGLAYLALGRDDRAAHFLRRLFPSTHDLAGEVARLRAEVRRLRARCAELERGVARPVPQPIDTRADLERGQDERLTRILRETEWNVSETARRLGISRPTVYRRMRRLGLATK